MTPVPKGYVALTLGSDGRTVLFDARGLVVLRGSGSTSASQKLPSNCVVGPVSDTESYWTVAETFDEVCAKLAAALGEQPSPSPALSDLERAVVEAAMEWCDATDNGGKLYDAIRALRAARGGA